MAKELAGGEYLDEWYLEGYIDGGRIIRRIPVNQLPFTIGRQPHLSLHLNTPDISKKHAEIFGQNSRLFIRDLDSTNGTYVNNVRIQEAVRIREGDILHFGKKEFRLAYEMASDSLLSENTVIFSGELPHDFETRTNDLKRLVEEKAVIPHFQPLIHLTKGGIFGYEILGRGNLEDFEVDPTELFHIASVLKIEAQLSNLFRLKGIEVGSDLPGNPNLFVNTHPKELDDIDAFLESLQKLRVDFPAVNFTVEIHESSVSDLSVMKSVRECMQVLGVGLAYDDFGAGQARLLELVDVPPDYLKFDRSLIRDIDQAPIKRQRMVEMFVVFLRETGVKSVAEGVATKKEADVCKSLGFDCAQGYFFGRPAPIDKIV